MSGPWEKFSKKPAPWEKFAKKEAAEQPVAQPQKPFAQVLRDNLIGDDDPTTQNLGEKIGSALNKAGESMTFGLVGDEASAAVESLAPGVDYDKRRDHYREQERLFEETNPGTALTADIAGALMLPGGIAAKSGGNLLARSLKSGAATGALSGVYGFAEGEGGVEERLDDAQDDATVGGAIGLAIPGVGSAIQKGANSIVGNRAVRQAVRNAPSTDQLKAAGQRAYGEVEKAGVSIKPQAFDSMRERIAETLRKGGLDQLPGPGSLTPKSARVSQIMDEMSGKMAAEPTASLPFSSLDQLRRQAGAAASDFTNKTDQKLGVQIIEGIDDFVGNLGPDSIDAGDADALKAAIVKARDTWSKMSRSQTIDDAIENSENYLSGQASGIRNQFKNLLGNKKRLRGFSDAEKQMMRRVVNGSLPQQLLNLLGGGMGQLGTIGLGAGAGGIGGALVGAGVAAGARKGSEALAARNAEVVRALIANGGMQSLPTANPQIAKIVEQMLIRGTAAAPQ